MPSRRAALTTNHPVVLTFLILAIIAFMSYAGAVLKPVAFAVLLSFALAPLTRFFQRRGLPRTPAAALAVLLALAVLGVVGYKVGQQLTSMLGELPAYEKNLIAKLQRVQPKGEGVIEKTSRVVQDVTKRLHAGAPPDRRDADEQGQPENTAIPVQVVSRPSLPDRLGTIFGPTLEYLGSGAFLLILVFFLLVNSEDLTERLVRLVGTRRVTLTTKMLEEMDQRISRYLITFATVNSTIGLVVGVGLSLIGVKYPVLWGVLAALLRFVPYVGPGAAFLLPFAFSIASSPGADLRQPVMVLGLFATIEVLANSYLEPVIYGKTTGVSSFGLLVAAMFWTWLWGAIGLLLSTPLTVCLAVAGKSIPGLQAFAILLGEEPPLEPDVRFYQRLMAMDQDGAVEVVEAALKQRPRAAVFDEILIPALSRTNRDAARGDIDEREQALVWRVIDDLLTKLADVPEFDLDTRPAGDAAQPAPAAAGAADGGAVALAGVPANDVSDVLALRMLNVLLQPAGLALTIVESFDTPLKLVERLARSKPALVLVSHVRPGGLTNARYLVRRIHARAEGLPLVVGRWGASADAEAAAEQFKSAGATGGVFFRLADARDRLIAQFPPAADTSEAPARAVARSSAAASPTG